MGDQSAILYGELSGPEDDEVVQVVAATVGVTYRCTGTLIAHNLVITARHCVAEYDDSAFTCTSAGELTPNSRGGRMGPLYNASQVSVHIGTGPKPKFGAQAVQLFATNTPTICRNDIALILLDRELSELPIAPIRLKKGTEPGEELRIIGYGVDETGNSGTRHTRSGLTISLVGPSEFRDPGDLIPPRTFVVEGPALCIGDSGGPAFVSNEVVAGVWSQVVGDCREDSARNFYTEVAPFADGLILPAFEAAGAEPWLEGNSGPGLNTGGTVGTGGVGAAGDVSTAGDGASETGGSVSTGGLVGSGGTPSSGGSTESGGTTSSGGSGEAGDGGLRKKGGCTCGVVGAPSGGAEFLLVPLAAFALLRRRRGR